MIAALLIVVFGVALTVLQSKNDSRQDRTVLTNCRSGNLRSAYELANHSDGPERASLVQDVLPLIDCEHLVAAGERVAIPLDVQQEYVRMVAQERVWPTLEHGAIVGSQPLPGTVPR